MLLSTAGLKRTSSSNGMMFQVSSLVVSVFVALHHSCGSVGVPMVLPVLARFTHTVEQDYVDVKRDHCTVRLRQ